MKSIQQLLLIISVWTVGLHTTGTNGKNNSTLNIQHMVDVNLLVIVLGDIEQLFTNNTRSPHADIHSTPPPPLHNTHIPQNIHTGPGTVGDPGPQCITNLPPSGQRGGPSFNTSYELVLIPNYKFTCYGNITKWKAYFPQAVSSTDQFRIYSIKFQVWRPTKSVLSYRKCYQLIGSNLYAHQHVESSGLFSANVPINDQIAVKPNDVIGLSNAKGLRMDEDRPMVLWYKRPTTIRNITLPIITTSVCLPLIAGQISTIKSTRAYAPVITAVVGEC